MIDVPDAPWVRDYDRFFQLHYQCKGGEELSDLWAYNPDRCDGGFCCYDCDKCSKAESDDEEDE